MPPGDCSDHDVAPRYSTQPAQPRDSRAASPRLYKLRLCMKLPWHLQIVWLSCVATALVGCGADDQPAAVELAPPAPTAEVEPSTPAPASEAESDKAAADVAATEEFNPPFPNRVDLFVAPGRAKVAARSGSGDQEIIELKGFITPPGSDGPWVMLAINGVESPIAVGQEKLGVRVISVDQPKVVLQRGRQVWTESLE